MAASGTVFALTPEEIQSADKYEVAAYKRVAVELQSGRRAWAYVDAQFAPPNVKQAVPFFGVTDIDASLRFYVDGLGFTLKLKWLPEGRIRWCWLERDGVAVMLQEYWKDGQRGGAPAGPLGHGVSICFMCADAIAVYHEALARGLKPARPFVGNNLWVTSFVDPDGYRLDFESPTDVPEDTIYEDPA
jgi:catechol 2,3-dioxygenase-like lactoylglutathione lyase family enzyme